ncbi:MAG: hypothetical protein IPK76_14540 [Lewinellaceae bacterium]|nr:hypothetical protein [Lewinellaceae bacterium]
MDEERLPLFCQNRRRKSGRARCGVQVPQTHRQTCLGGVFESGWFSPEPQTVFLYRHRKDWTWILERYALRFQIELFHLPRCQTICRTNSLPKHRQNKLENHFNLALGAVSVAKAAHWLPIDKEQQALSLWQNKKTYYHNLALVERFSIALNLNPNRN